MLTCRVITEEPEELAALYGRAFPANERRSLTALLSDTTGSAEVLAFYDGQRFVGFTATLRHGDIVHILYFAVTEGIRGRGYGGEILTQIAARRPGCRILADLELPDAQAPADDQRHRRMAFYKRNGFAETDVRYRWRGEDYVILSKNGTVTDEEFRRFWEALEGVDPRFGAY